MGRFRGGRQPGQTIRWSQYTALIAISMSVCALGQLGFEDLGGAMDKADTPPAPPMRLTDVARQNTFEHHVASRTHRAASLSAPAPAPLGLAVPVGAPGPGQLSVYDLLPPERLVEGIGMAPAPAPFAAAPAAADTGFTSPLGGQADYYGVAAYGQGDEGMAAAPAPAEGLAAPGQAPLAAVGAGGGGGAMQATEVVNPPSPVAYVDTDGSLIYVGVPPPGAPNQALAAAGATSGFDQYFWPIVALLGLLGIFASVAWAFSKRRAARRYIDLKDTEMAMQQRDMHGPHSTS